MDDEKKSVGNTELSRRQDVTVSKTQIETGE
jgi:hypothetical protein